MGGYAIEILITVLLGGYALTRLLAIQADSRKLTTEALPVLARISQVDSQLGVAYATALRRLHATPGAESEALARELHSQSESLGQLVGQVEANPSALQDSARTDSIRSAHAAFSEAIKPLLSADAPLQEPADGVARRIEPACRHFRDSIRLARELTQDRALAAGAAIQTAVTRAEAMIVAGLCASILIVGFSCYRVVRAINLPLTRLTRALEEMRQGDFTGRLEADRRDEFGELAAGFNHMADSLSSLVSQVQESGIVVNSSSTLLASTARQQESSAQETAATTVEIGATAKEISATSQDLVKTVKEVATVAEQTTSMAGNGQSGLLRMQETMVQVMTAAGAISGKLNVLNEKAGSISQVVTTIAKVADQTNLLSLNAAIEAEKAGEYGRGFSVVATEIRRLADQTAVASHDIEQTVKEMQAAVSAGVMSVDKFSEEVRRGVQEVNQVGSQLNEIIRHVQALTPRFESVNEGMQMHAVGAQQISASLIQLGDSTQQTVNTLRQSNLTIERLNEASSLLRNAVSRFKLQGSVPVPTATRSVDSLSIRRSSDWVSTSSGGLDV